MKSRYVIALIIILMITASTYAPAVFNTNSVHFASGATTPNVGIFVPTVFTSAWGSATIQKFYNVVFGTGIFNSMEMFTPLGMSYSNSLTDTVFTQQIVQLAKIAEQNHNPIKIALIVDMDFQYNGTNREYVQLQNFLNAVKPYPEVYSLGVNWERGTYGCDAFTSACGWTYAVSKYGSATVSNSIAQFQNMVQSAGKLFVSYYGPPSNLGIAPPQGQLWLNIGNTGYPIALTASGQASSEYTTVGWFVKPSSIFNYIGISNGYFIARPMPDPVFYVNMLGQQVATCTLTTYTGPCGPGGQWNNVTVDWFFQQEASLFKQYPSARQFLMLGGYGISGENKGPLVDSSLPAQFWNSQLFQNWVKQSEQKYGLVPSVVIQTSSSSSTSTQTSTTTSSSSTTTTTSTLTANAADAASCSLSKTSPAVGNWDKVTCTGLPLSSTLEMTVFNKPTDKFVAYLFPGSTSSSGTCAFSFSVTSSMVGTDTISIYSPSTATSPEVTGLVFTTT